MSWLAAENNKRGEHFMLPLGNTVEASATRSSGARLPEKGLRNDPSSSFL